MYDASKENFNSKIDTAQRLLEKLVSLPSSVIGLQPMNNNQDALMSFGGVLWMKRRGVRLHPMSLTS
ncbi:hypothetical protein CK203_017504 [Vitis vinifera]|uniref:Uncharacterized protein n=1 Tax=Vitis vinifera TaxID=29760 RepID=A0A438IXU6_VITVI|nr:hypothetical protein CK203_017504 [Vitis vinifera]